MLDEGSATMEKKSVARQSPAPGQCKNGAVTSERKSDFTPNRRGHGRRSGSNGGTKTQDAGQPTRPSPIHKWDKSVGNRRQRQRNGYDYRQREEVEEHDDAFDVLSTGSRKGNLNHLLNFKFLPRRQSQIDDHRWHDRGHYNSQGHGGYRKRKRYKKEQFLQASCQFVVRDTGDYTEQAINSDALVDWNMIELVRSFCAETVNCPICLEIPIAGKITKCGHTYCWACILHYLKLGEGEARKCPICYETVDVDDLKSVRWIDVPNFKVGDSIDMKLMKKAKGSVITMPKDQWEDRLGKPMNMLDEVNTEYMKLLVASSDQIQTEVIEMERAALTVQLEEAEESESCFIQMALEYLEKRENTLKQVFQQTAQNKDKAQIPGLWSNDAVKTLDVTSHVKSEENLHTKSMASVRTDKGVEDETIHLVPRDSYTSRKRHDSDCSLPFGSPPCPFPLVPDQEVNPVPLTLEETHDHLELPINIPQASAKQQSKISHSLNVKDNYFFYQASTGQQIYLNSLNAQCMAREYGSLEESPNNIKGTIVAIERIFMTEDVRKRLRYLDHIPLTCEVHIVELKLKPPIVSKDTLRFFEAAFEKKRKQRQQKEREDKRRAKHIEIEHMKSFGIYSGPEVQIPLDSLEQFPSHLSASNSLEEDISANGPPLVSPLGQHQHGEDEIVSRRLRNDSTTSDDSFGGSVSFAQMLRAGKTTPGAGGAWGRTCPPPASDSMHMARSRHGDNGDDDDSGGECLPAPTNSFSFSDAITKALDDFNLRRQSADNTSPSNSGKGRKKKKEKWIPLL